MTKSPKLEAQKCRVKVATNAPKLEPAKLKAIPNELDRTFKEKQPYLESEYQYRSGSRFF